MLRPSRLRRWAVAALLAAALPLHAAAVPRPLSQRILERWTPRDGLPHNVVHRLLVARTGYLWIGTQEGLVRFDGVRFKVYVRGDTPGLASNEITALREDARGVVWIGTSRGLSRLIGDAWEVVDLGVDAAVTDLAMGADGDVWAATEASGVLRLRGGRPGKAERLEGLPDQRVLAVAWSGEGLWIGGYGGLARWSERGLELLGAVGGPEEAVTRLLHGRDGTLWVGTSSGLLRRRPGAGALERLALPSVALVGALLEDHQGALWVGRESGQVLRLVDGRIEAVAGLPDPLTSLALAEDADGDLWIGSESSGLFRLRWGQVVTIATEEGLAADAVWSVQEGRGGVTWVASDGGLDRLSGGRVERVHAQELAGTSLGGLLEDRAGALWVGTGRELYRFDRGRTTRYGPAQGLPRQLVRTILEDRRGVLWVGTAHGVFRLAGERFVPLATDPRLAGDKVNILVEHPDGTLWVGATTGLARVEGDRVVLADAGGEAIRADVTALRADPDGALWIGTVGEGLARLSAGRLRRWTQREGLHEDTILAILDDGAGHLWMSGTHGISRVDRSELEGAVEGQRGVVKPQVFGAADGMRDRECNGGATPAAWRAADGRLWFATIHGVAAIDPARLEPPRGPPPARVEELVADGRAWSTGAAPRLPPGTRRLEVRYTGLALAAADRIRFRHRLTGLDDTFVEAGSERIAHYTNLGPGSYLFEVSAASAAGEWGPPAALAFEVAPHVWQTPWFAAAVLLSALALAAGAYRARTRALRRREALLAARVEEEMRKVKILTGLLPTCAWCSKVRDEAGSWRRFEDYLGDHADVEFTHGMCPECYARLEGGGRPP